MIDTNGFQIPHIELPRAVLDRLQADFEYAIFEPAYSSGARDPEILEALGAAYHKLGKYDGAIEICTQWSHQLPFESEPYYQIARAYASTNRTTDTMKALEKAFTLGFEDFERLSADAAFDSVRKLSEFKEMIESTGHVI